MFNKPILFHSEVVWAVNELRAFYPSISHSSGNVHESKQRWLLNCIIGQGVALTYQLLHWPLMKVWLVIPFQPKLSEIVSWRFAKSELFTSYSSCILFFFPPHFTKHSVSVETKLPFSLNGGLGRRKLQFQVYIGMTCLVESKMRVKRGRSAGISKVCSIFSV